MHQHAVCPWAKILTSLGLVTGFHRWSSWFFKDRTPLTFLISKLPPPPPQSVQEPGAETNLGFIPPSPVEHSVRSVLPCDFFGHVTYFSPYLLFISCLVMTNQITFPTSLAPGPLQTILITAPKLTPDKMKQILAAFLFKILKWFSTI